MNKTIFPGWWQVVVSMLNQAAAPGTIIICFSVIAAPLSREFGASRSTLGLIMTLTYLINGIMNPLLGAAMDRYSIRRIMVGGGILLAAGYAALSFTTSLTWVFVTFGLLLAMANVVLGPLSYSALLPRWFVRRRARAVGITVAGYAIGGLFMPPVFAGLIDAFGWREALRLFAAFVLVVLVPLLARLVIDRPSDVGLYPDGASQPPQVATVQGAEPSQSTASLLRDPNFWVITIVIGLVLCGAAGVLSNMVPFAISRGFTARQGALFLTCFSAGSLTSKLLYTFFGDRLNPRVGLSIGLGFLVLSSCFFLRGFAFRALLLASFLHGMGVGTALPLWTYLTARVFGTANVGRVFGLMNIVTMPISLSMPPLMGAIFDHTHSYDDGFILYICLGLGAFFLIPRLRIVAPDQHELLPQSNVTSSAVT
ncbi:MAG TPA: MFS transporter [Steroidobacteraceae bacterium]|jgi:sugar phosphate permease|nr:MFS transporter [Steroidobacteraceae bacterium]